MTNKRADYFKQYYQVKREEIIKQKKGYRQMTRLEVVRILGGKCGNCGHAVPENLSVVTETKRGRMGYTTYYNMLYRMALDGTLEARLLCGNCR